MINAFERGVQSYQGVQDRIDVLTNRINELTGARTARRQSTTPTARSGCST